MTKVFAVTIFLALAQWVFSQEVTEFRLQVENIKKAQGNICIAIYDSESTFLSEEVVHSIIIPIHSEGTLSIPVSVLSHGIYAVSAFHDKNGNEELDTGLFGIPTEPYGFSNKAKGMFGPPGYDKCKFEFNAQNRLFFISLNSKK